MKKRFAGVFLALVMVLSLLPMTALAVDVVDISNNIGITTESTQDTLDAALGAGTATLSSENGAILVTLQKSISFAPTTNLSFGQGGHHPGGQVHSGPEWLLHHQLQHHHRKLCGPDHPGQQRG